METTTANATMEASTTVAVPTVELQPTSPATVEPPSVAVTAEPGGEQPIATAKPPVETRPNPRPVGLRDPDAIGIPECDLYMQMWKDCYRDPMVRAAAEPGFQTMRESFKKMARGGPAEREALVQACRAMVDAFAQVSCK